MRRIAAPPLQNDSFQLEQPSLAFFVGDSLITGKSVSSYMINSCITTSAQDSYRIAGIIRRVVCSAAVAQVASFISSLISSFALTLQPPALDCTLQLCQHVFGRMMMAAGAVVVVINKDAFNQWWQGGKERGEFADTRKSPAGF